MIYTNGGGVGLLRGPSFLLFLVKGERTPSPFTSVDRRAFTSEVFRMANKSPATVASKWQNRTKAAVNEMKAGVDAVTTAPGQQAAAAADVWQQRLQQAETLDKFRRNVGAVSLQQWKDAMTSKGVQRVAAGVDAATPVFTQFMTDFLPHVQSVAARVKSMPHLTVEDGINRAAEQIRGNATFRFNKR